MGTLPKSSSPAPGRIRVLSIDGGGIYGLATALWLRRLCEKNEYFLSGDDIRLFAGTSAGALNCLLLAAHRRPREAILNGELEHFWRSMGVFANSDPLRHMLSSFGYTGWFSSTDFRALLERTFGRRTLGELEQQVLISSFNWTGSHKRPRQPSRAAQPGPHWKPKFFDNACTLDPDYSTPIVEVAYAAAAPPTLRPMFGGLGDGGSFSGNPTLPAIAHLVRHYYFMADGLDGLDLEVNAQSRLTPVQMLSQLYQHREGLLSRLAVLSIGSGQWLPHLEHGDVDLGLLFAYAPTNPWRGNFWPTAAFSTDPANEEANYIAKQFLGRARALRLNPAVLEIPSITATMMARNPLIKQWLSQLISDKALGRASAQAIENTDRFLRRTDGWDCWGVSDFAVWTPPRQLSDRATASAPALATVTNGAVYMAWRGMKQGPEHVPGDFTNLWVSSAEGSDALWRDQRQAYFLASDGSRRACGTEQHFTSAAPALAWHDAEDTEGRGLLLMAWTVAGQGVMLSVGVDCSYEQDKRKKWQRRWSPPELVPGTRDIEHSRGPTLAINAAGVVVLAWCDEQQIRLRRGELSGKRVAWEREDVDIDCCTTQSPSLCANQSNEFGLVWADPDRPLIHMAMSKDGRGWSTYDDLHLDTSSTDPDGPQSGIVDGGPALGFIDQRWYIAWRGPDELMWIAVSPPCASGSWLPPLPLLDRRTQVRPSFARVCAPDENRPPRLMMSWTGTPYADEPSNNIWVSTLPLPRPVRCP